MDFKRSHNYFTGLSTLFFATLFFIGCSNKEKDNIDKTFYIELVNFTHDSLKQKVSENIFGKASIYKKDKLEILSLNYVTEDYPKMHYFQNIEVLGKEIKENSKKIRIEFKGDFSLDSIKYSLQKFKYTNKEWVKISDLGVLKETKKFVQPINIIIEYVSQIVNNTVEYSYN